MPALRSYAPPMKLSDPRIDTKFVTALQRFLLAYGVVKNLRVMEDGHAGLTFGFELASENGSSRGYILKKAPEGVPRSGSTDIFRQVALLRVLHRSDFPAPDVPWADKGEEHLGTPFIIMERLPGRSVMVLDPLPSVVAQFRDLATMWTETARFMGKLHVFDWQHDLAHWQQHTDLGVELERWTRLLRHMQDQEIAELAQRLARLLAHYIPTESVIGLVHGDLQPGNVLFEDGAAQGLIDWDLAAIGPIGMDVGWLLMFADTEGWAEDWKAHGAPSRAILLEAYCKAGGEPPAEIDWFQAFSHFRMAAITGLNLKLHRDGRRHDPLWERFASSVPLMLNRGFALLQHAKENAA